MKSVLVIGMGRFGRHLATKIHSLKNDVMIVDKDRDLIDEFAPHFTDACVGDCTNDMVLRSLGINNFDICFVTIGDNFQSSLEITLLLKELGAHFVVSRAKRDIHAKFLLRNGADEIIYPEKEMAIKLAIRHSAKHIFDFIDITPEFAIFEIPVIESWIGRSIASANIRRQHTITILAIKHENNLQPLPSADYVFQAEDHVVVVGKPADVFKLTEKS